MLTNGPKYMTSRKFFTLLCFMWFVGLHMTSHAIAQQSFLPFDHFKNAISTALARARELNDEEPYFLVKRIKLDLQVVKGEGAGAGLSLPVFGVDADIGAEASRLITQNLKLELKPVEKVVVGGTYDLDFAPVISAVKRAFKKKKEDSIHYEIPQMEYQFAFQLQRKMGVGIKFLLFHVNAESSEVHNQKVTFILCETENLKNCVDD